MVLLQVEVSEFNVLNLVINPKPTFNDFLGIENVE